MAILSGPQNAGIPGYKQIKPAKPKVTVGPQNVGLPGYRPGDPGVGYGPSTGYVPPAPAAPAPAPPPPAPPPIDFNALTLTDPQYTTGRNQLEQQNTLTLEQLLKGYRGQAQGYQDNANAHGALFSGAAVNAQRNAAQGYADQQRQQALNYGAGQSNLYFDVWNRLKQQLAGGT